MYPTLLIAHSLFRWLVLLSLLWALGRAGQGYVGRQSFTRADNVLRHWTATIAHTQLLLGMALYTQSPVVKGFFREFAQTGIRGDGAFFGLVHLGLMLSAIVVITIGSALARRRADDQVKFQTLLRWFSVGLLLILLAIPWPFSPLAHRPYLRLFYP